MSMHPSTPPPDEPQHLCTTRHQVEPHPNQSDDLSKRCRQLARSVGHASVYEQQQLSPMPLSPQLSPRTAALNLAAPGSPNKSASPRSSYPTPEGSFVHLSGIMEDEPFDPLQSAPAATTSHSLGAHSHGSHQFADDEMSSRGGSRVSSWHQTSHISPFDALKLQGDSFDQALLRSSMKDGVSSFEIDVWLVDGELLVGPDQASLTSDHTLTSMYLDPLLSILSAPQPSTPSSLGEYSFARRRSSTTALHRSYAHTPLLLLLNLRTSPVMTLQFLLHFLSPLLDASLLTSYCQNADVVTPGLVTVACACAPDDFEALTDDIKGLTPRYVFAAADVESDLNTWHKDLTPVINGSATEVLGESDPDVELTEVQKSKSEVLVKRAHTHGVKLRLGGLPKSSTAALALLAMGVDYV